LRPNLTKIGRVDDTPVFELGKLAARDGPVLMRDSTQAVVVDPGARAILASSYYAARDAVNGEPGKVE
jgi:hypothetical protein